MAFRTPRELLQVSRASISGRQEAEILTTPPNRIVSLLIFLVVVLGVGFTIGLTIRPGDWYEALSKPFFTPPNWLFGPAWTLVYTLVALAGWRVLVKEGPNSPAFRLWLVQMVLNWAWTPVFFGLHQIGIGLVVIVCLLATVLASCCGQEIAWRAGALLPMRYGSAMPPL